MNSKLRKSALYITSLDGSYCQTACLLTFNKYSGGWLERLLSEWYRTLMKNKITVNVKTLQNKKSILWFVSRMIRGHFFSSTADVSTPKYCHVTKIVMVFQITGISNVCSIVSSGTHKRKHQISASLGSVGEINDGERWFPLTKGQLRGKFDDVIINLPCSILCGHTTR